MNLLQFTEFDCPYCGETIELAVDTSLPLQETIEDCAVCCRPISLRLSSSPGEVLAVNVRREDEV